MITFLFCILCTISTYLFQLFSLLFYLIMDFLFILFAFFTKIRKKILFHDISVRENQDCKFWKLKKIRIRYAKTIPSPDFLFYSSSCTRIARDNSSSCFSSTRFGASLIRQEASFTFGNAITSRILSDPVISMIIRSRP